MFLLVIWSLGVIFEPFVFTVSVEPSPVVTRLIQLATLAYCRTTKNANLQDIMVHQRRDIAAGTWAFHAAPGRMPRVCIQAVASLSYQLSYSSQLDMIS